MFQNIIEIIILSAIQGISEFLPISSSAHLILVSSLYEFKSNSLLIDISLHLGSLLAIIYFFRNELLDTKNNKRLLGLIILGSIPLIIVGYILVGGIQRISKYTSKIVPVMGILYLIVCFAVFGEPGSLSPPPESGIQYNLRICPIFQPSRCLVCGVWSCCTPI